MERKETLRMEMNNFKIATKCFLLQCSYEDKDGNTIKEQETIYLDAKDALEIFNDYLHAMKRDCNKIYKIEMFSTDMTTENGVVVLMNKKEVRIATGARYSSDVIAFEDLSNYKADEYLLGKEYYYVSVIKDIVGCEPVKKTQIFLDRDVAKKAFYEEKKAFYNDIEATCDMNNVVANVNEIDIRFRKGTLRDICQEFRFDNIENIASYNFNDVMDAE